MHPLLALLATKPYLLLEHAQAYGALIHDELGLIHALWRKRTLLYALALCSMVVAAVLAGGALMLWAVTPAAHLDAFWVLLIAPLVPLGFALGCLMRVRKLAPGEAFANLNRQLDADIDMLHAAGAL